MKTLIMLISVSFFGVIGAANVNQQKGITPEYHILLPEIVITPDKSELYREGSMFNPIALEEVVITGKKI